MKGKFVVQTHPASFKATSPDRKLEQIINMSQKSSGGIVGQAKANSCVTEWELVYHEILAISNCFSDLSKSKTRTGPFLHHELGGNASRNLKDTVTKVVKFTEERGNPYKLTTNPKLHNFTSGQVVSEKSTAKLY